MSALSAYVRDRRSGVRMAPDAGTPAGYLDGAEQRLLDLLRDARDRSVGSPELHGHVRDWPSQYHLTPYRSTIFDALGFGGAGDARVLELGAGCGAITRWLGERCGTVHAVEGDPLRAAVARARTLDQANVDVFAANYSELTERGGYDLVTLIGVLEYGHLYHPGTRDPDAAALANLRVARTALDGGALVLAIENRLGLKYLNGAREDHSGRLHESVQGYPHATSAVTFSRRRLLELLSQAGFGAVSTYLPFPDYKLATTIVAADALEPGDGAHNWLPATAGDRGHAGRAAAHYHESLALREVCDAGLLPDLANSLLLVAYAGERAEVDERLGIETGWKVRHYSLSRPRRTAKRVTIAGVGETVRNQPAFGSDGGESVHGVLRHRLADEDHVQGDLLVWEMHEAVAGADAGEPLTQAAQAHETWLVDLLGTGAADGDGVALLDGAAFDAVWWNVVRTPEGQRQLIDREWRCELPIPVDVVTYRCARHYALRWGVHLPDPWRCNPDGFAGELVRRVHPQTSVHRLRHVRDVVGCLEAAALDVDFAGAEEVVRRLADPAQVRTAGLDARAFVVLLDADEAVTHPSLASVFADAFDAHADATLVLCAPGWGEERMAAELAPMLARTGLDTPVSPDVLAVPVGVRELATQANAVLTAAPSTEDLGVPRVRVGGARVLRELERQRRASLLAA